MTTPNDIGPPSLFHITVDYICDGTKELPNLSTLPEYLLQLILARILSSGQNGAALQVLRHVNLFTSLDLPASVVVDDAWLAAISCQANSLEELNIEDCSNVTGQGLQLLGKFTNLKRVHLCQLSCWSQVATDTFTTMDKVEHLHLEGPVLVDDWMCSRLEFLRCLKHLGLVGALGLSSIEHCSKVAEMCPRLQQVDMSESDIQDEGLCALLKHLRQVRSICLKGCEAISDASSSVIGSLPHLEMLNLARTNVGDIGVSMLQKLDQLRTLVLCGTKVSDKSLKVINVSIHALTELDISCKRVTDLGLRQLSSLANLTTLNLSYTQVSDEGMLALRKLPKLTNLSLRWTRITDWALGQLTTTEQQQAMPQEEPAEPAPLPALSLKRVGKSGSSSDTLPLRRSKSLRQSRRPPRNKSLARNRELNRGMSKSGDYSQVLSRCRATMDFSKRHQEVEDDITPTSQATSTASESSFDPQKTPVKLQGCQSSVRVVEAEDFEVHIQPVAPSMMSALVCDDDNIGWHESENMFDYEQPSFRSISPTDFDHEIDQPMTLTQEFERPVYRSIGDDDDVDGMLQAVKSAPSQLEQLEPVVLRGAEPMDFLVPEKLSFAPRESMFAPCTNTTICAPQLSDTTSFATLPSVFGPSQIFCPHSAPSQNEDDDDDQLTLQEMRVLDLSVTDIADSGLSFLKAFSQITSLNLFSTKVTDDGLVHVAKLDHLTDLDLCGTEVSDAGLCQLEPLQNLEVLKACGNVRITDGGASRLLEAVEALQNLELRSTSVTPGCLEMIATVLATRARQAMQ